MTGTPTTRAGLYTQFPTSGPAGGITPTNMQNLIASLPTVGVTFQCVHGNFYAPNGSIFIPKGINLEDWAAINASGGSGGTNNGALLPILFPGINMVRLACEKNGGLVQSNGNDDPAQFATFIANCTANNIVVLVEDHNTSQTVLTGSALTTESAWYASWATAYGSNPYVWFGTMNEPKSQGNEGLVTTQQVATYNAVRGTGCQNPVIMELIGGYEVTDSSSSSLTAASYTTLSNIGWDFHFYNYLATNGATPYTANYGTIASSLTSSISTLKAFTTSANGIMPILIGESGPSTDGTNQDPGGTQTILAGWNSGLGVLNWAWREGTSDAISDGSSNLTVYGTAVSAWIAGADVMGPTLGQSPFATQSTNPLNITSSATYNLVLQGPSVPTYTAGSYALLTVTARDQTSGIFYATSFMYFITRAGSSATITESAAFGVIGTAGTIAFGSGTLSLSWTSISTDGSGYTLALNNTGSNTLSVWVNLTPPIFGP